MCIELVSGVCGLMNLRLNEILSSEVKGWNNDLIKILLSLRRRKCYLLLG